MTHRELVIILFFCETKPYSNVDPENISFTNCETEIGVSPNYGKKKYILRICFCIDISSAYGYFIVPTQNARDSVSQSEWRPLNKHEVWSGKFWLFTRTRTLRGRSYRVRSIRDMRIAITIDSLLFSYWVERTSIEHVLFGTVIVGFECNPGTDNEQSSIQGSNYANSHGGKPTILAFRLWVRRG